VTFDEFKNDLLTFIGCSNVNLGRKTSQTRNEFLKEIDNKFNEFVSHTENHSSVDVQSKGMERSVLCNMPTKRNRIVDPKSGIAIMTPGESMRADEQLNRSPFGKKKGNK